MLEAVLGRPAAHLSLVEGWLDGYSAERAEDYSFPILCAKNGASTLGHLAIGLDAEDIARIAYFEDSEYELTTASIRTPFALVTANVYRASPKLRSSGELWSLVQFQTADRALLLAVTRHVMRKHFGVTPQTDMERMWNGIRDQIAQELGAVNAT